MLNNNCRNSRWKYGFLLFTQVVVSLSKCYLYLVHCVHPRRSALLSAIGQTDRGEEREEKRTTINDSKSWQRELSVHCFSSIFIWLRCCKKKAHFGREEPDILICFIHANTYRHTYACTCTSSIYAYRAQWSYIRTSAWCTEYSKNITTYINESVWLNHKEVTIRPSLSSQTTMWFHPNKYKLS